ncbi:MAG: phage virion morphogenesis protein [Acetobacteraceae bacterium]|nr:phage virion morphogenesis protein [Acetobacteraceae bacterium]
MSGASIRIEVDDAEVRRAFAGLAALGEDMTRPLADIGSSLVQSTALRFEAERGPGGIPWKKSGRALAQGGQTLSDTGRLKASITHRAGAKELLVGTDTRYAAIHQFGGTIRAKGKALAFSLPWLKRRGDSGMRFVKSVTIPARPFLGLDAGDREMIAETIAAHVARIAGAGGSATSPGSAGRGQA